MRLFKILLILFLISLEAVSLNVLCCRAEKNLDEATLTDQITHLVEVPEIRKRLRIPISVDFREVSLDYVLDFLSDATGVNIIAQKGINLEEKKVTIRVKDMPLESLLKYILKNQGLTYRIEKNAVWVTSLSEMEKEALETRVYFLNQGLAMFTEFSGQAAGVKEGLGGAPGISEIKTIKDTLEKAVSWPKDSKINLDERTGALIITNTPSNLEIIEELLYNLDTTPVQVLIEARFIEVDVTDLKELGMEWALSGNWAVTKDGGTPETRVTGGSGVNFTSFTGAPNEGLNLTYQGILTRPEFSIVMHALEKTTRLKTLSAPKITTLNNQTATIEVVDEFVYPTRYEPSLIKEDLNSDGDFLDTVGGVKETRFVNVPQGFETRNIGILLHVTPSVGRDKRTITLSLVPEVSEATANAFEYSGEVKLPKFTTRNLNTSIVVKNGETVVLGGLIKETDTKVRTKVPLLGDLPIIGMLFRKDSDSVQRRNLLIFVTANIVGPKGEKLL